MLAFFELAICGSFPGHLSLSSSYSGVLLFLIGLPLTTISSGGNQ